MRDGLSKKVSPLLQRAARGGRQVWGDSSCAGRAGSWVAAHAPKGPWGYLWSHRVRVMMELWPQPPIHGEGQALPAPHPPPHSSGSTLWVGTEAACGDHRAARARPVLVHSLRAPGRAWLRVGTVGGRGQSQDCWAEVPTLSFLFVLRSRGGSAPLWPPASSPARWESQSLCPHPAELKWKEAPESKELWWGQ